MGKETFFDKKDDPLKTLADQGDIRACAKLGAEYIAGNNRSINKPLGLQYIEKAAEAGYAGSCLYLIRHYQTTGETDNCTKYIQLALQHENDESYGNQRQTILVIKSFMKQHPELAPKAIQLRN